MSQNTIFDQAEKAKHDGQELVYRRASTTWKRKAAAKLHEVIQTKHHFTSEDVIIPLEREGIVTKDNRAIAAILVAFARTGLIKSTDNFIRSRRRSRHGAPIMVWESNLRVKEGSK